ncbi:MAG: zinc-dependent alcohol dehydrogenase family protein [Trueperaceae bacterium]|nr:zinc-dependent alcohol dehydrogenase family protein [Trueperaceae bacterium]
MKAALYHEFATALTVETVPEPVCPADGVIIEVKANGICRSDWHAWMGHDASIKLPHVPGHELSGVIAECGREVKNWQPGERVTTPFCGACGSCEQCLSGNQHICDHDYQPGFSGWGSFAQYVMIPKADTNLVRLPESLDFVEAASLGCRFMTAFRGVVDQAKLRPGEYLAVYGCGGVGLSGIMIGVALGAQVIAVDIDETKLELAKSLGAVVTINAKDGKPYGAIRDLTGGGVHVSVDALGSQLTCRNAIHSLRKRGRHVQIGLMLADDANASLPMYAVIAKELEIYGSHGMQAHRYPAMLDMIVRGRLEPKRLIGKTVSLEQAGTELMSMGQFSQAGVTVINSF